MLRGVAVLGILPINMQSYSMVGIAMVNPTAYGDLSGANRWIFSVGYVLADQEFMTLFAMLFAAGWLMLAERVEAGGGSALGVHYRRTLALLAIGAAHAYLLWENDILVPYAQCALVLYPLRRARAGVLLALGLAFYAVYSLLALREGLALAALPAGSRFVLEAQWSGHPAAVAREIAVFRHGGWLDQVALRSEWLFYSHTVRFFSWTLWRIGGVMLLGMALYKLGVLDGRRSPRFYGWLALLGLGLGLSLRIYGVVSDFAAGWSMGYSKYFGMQWNYWGSLCSALGYLGAVHCIVRAGWLPGLLRRLAEVGRLTLTNYLLQTLICTTLFYGYGLGWFGSVSRTGQLGVVIAVWVFQLAFSAWWTRRFPFGPAEAVLRAAAYLRPPPLRVAW